MCHEPLPLRVVRPPLRPVPLYGNEVQKYLSRLSGPLLDRIDLFVEVDALDFEERPSGSLESPPPR